MTFRPGRDVSPQQVVPAPASGVVETVQNQVVPTPAPAPVASYTSSSAPGVSVKKSLITGGAATDIPWTGSTPAALRVRRIFPDEKLMAPEPVLVKGDSIELALFDDAVLEAEISNVTRYINGAVGLTAHLRNGREGTLFLSYCDGQMLVSVQVMGGNDFYVKYNPETRTHYAVEVDREKSIVLEGAEPLVPPVKDSAADASVKSGVATPTAMADAPAGSTVVDVMIVYTPAALAYEGNVANMNANIAQAMQKANEAHTNSDTQVYLNLIHSAEVNYTEVDPNTDLENLTYTGAINSAMDEVHTWRDQYGADLICLFESTEAAGGLGWLLSSTNGRPDYAFCLARVQQSDWTYTVVHEWGHNMGCGHSKTQTSEKGPGLYSYSSGWQWDDTSAATNRPWQRGYCSIMTYEDFNNDKTNEYIRVAYFSNPTNYYTGNSTNAMGHADNGDNARTIRQMKTVLAGYRASPPDVTLSLSGSPMAEAGGAAVVTATLSKTHTWPVTVNLAFSGTATLMADYTRSATNIVIAAGGTTGAVTLTAVQDAIYEGNETIVVDVDSVVNGTTGSTQQVIATIIDDDPKPDDLSVTPRIGVTFVGPVGGGSVSPSNQVYTLTNAGTNALNWSAAKTSSWANLSATSGALAAGAVTNVIVTVNSGALTEGVYYDTVTFTNTTRGISNITRQVSMTVTPPYIYFFPLNTDPGWERSGEWAFGQPMGQGGSAHGNPDPANGATGTNVFGVNLAGDYATASAGGPHYLKAGPFNFSGYTNVILHFQRWLNTDDSDYVPSTVDVSFNGTTWSRIYGNTGEVADVSWGRYEHSISSVADRQSFVYVRWGYQMVWGNSAYAYSGWNIDDIGFLGTSVSVTPYTVTFDAQNGTVPNPVSKIVTNGAMYGALPDTTREGYEFGGWWTGEEGSGDKVIATTIVTLISAQVLYAKWIPPPSTLTVNNGSGSGSYVSPEQVVITANPPAIGKTFDRWIGDTQRVASVTSSPTTLRMPVSNITVTATYKNIEYLLTVNDGAGGGAYIYGTNVTITATPVAGKVFFKWFGATQYVAGITSSRANVTMPASNITLSVSNVVDITKPTVAITLPTAALRIFSNATYTVRGTAADNKVVTNVMVKLNSGDYAPAITTNGWKTWSAQVQLVTGSNTVRAYSTDLAFNNSLTSTVACTYVVYGNLTIQTNGVGTVTRAPTGAPEVNKTYTLTAAAGTGSVFSNWTGDVATTTNKVITFVMTSNKTVRANFIDIAKPTVAITAPTALQKVYGTNGDFTVRGTATDNFALSNVTVKVNGGSPLLGSVTTNVWKSWSQPVTLIPGTNTITAYSRDTTGNTSATVTVKCVYIETGTLNITTNGPGKVTVAPTGALELGKTYTLTATANVGGVFSNWTGDVVIGSPAGKVVKVTLNATNKTVAVTANFTDTAKPTVVITYPANNAKVMTNGTVIIRGTAADNGILKEIKYQLYSGDWTNAVSTNVFKAWTASYEPVAGLNTSLVYSVDMQNNHSMTQKVVFTYIPGAVLTVQTNTALRGTIAPSLNGKVLQIGSTNTMTATAKAGCVFTNWTYGEGGLVATNTKAIKFVMTSNLVLTANFRSLAIPDAVADVLAAPQAAIVVDGATEDWANVPSAPVVVYYPDSANPVVAVTQDVSVVLSGNNVALLLTGCPFGTSDTVLVYFKLRLTCDDGNSDYSVDLWTSGSVLYGMVDGQVITGFEAVLLNGVLEVKIPVSDSRLPSKALIETVGVMMR